MYTVSSDSRVVLLGTNENKFLLSSSSKNKYFSPIMVSKGILKLPGVVSTIKDHATAYYVSSIYFYSINCSLK